jgi:hypothetical protein
MWHCEVPVTMSARTVLPSAVLMHVPPTPTWHTLGHDDVSSSSTYVTSTSRDTPPSSSGHMGRAAITHENTADTLLRVRKGREKER